MAQEKSTVRPPGRAKNPNQKPFELADTSSPEATILPPGGVVPSSMPIPQNPNKIIFNINTLKSLTDPVKIYYYLNNSLSIFDRGTSLVSYDIGNDILKFSLDHNGFAENHIQARLSGQSPLFVKVLEHNSTYQWIIVEKVIKFVNDEFLAKTGIPVKTFKNINPEIPLADQNIKLNQKTYELLQKIVDTANEFKVISVGMFNPNNWGLNQNGELKFFNLAISNTYKNVAGGKEEVPGTGSSRQVFDIGNDRVLKLAKNKAGIAQNTMEMRIQNSNPLFAKIFDVDKKGLWVIAEKITPFKSGEFEDFTEIPEIINEKEFINKFHKLDEATLRDIKKDLRLSDKATIILKQMIMAALKYNLLLGDTLDPKHWGLNSSGEMKLYDYGLDNKLFDTYYDSTGQVKEAFKHK
jgi:hypothetical protein